VAEGSIGNGSQGGRFQRFEASALTVKIFGAHSFSLHAAASGASQQLGAALGRYDLNGFHRLSGYNNGELLGNYVLFSRLNWYLRMAESAQLKRALFLGATLEAGNTYRTRDELRDGTLRIGTSLYAGADTALGPLYLALTHAPRGRTGIVLFLGRP